jgi:hypothetical protein
MDAFIKYILNTPNLKNRVFISNPPCPHVLLWSNSNNLPYITGISILEMECRRSNCIGISVTLIEKVFRERLNVPIIKIKYPATMEYLEIDGQRYSLTQAAYLISNTFNVQLSSAKAKRINKDSQVNDRFHIWSRDTFDGINVKKVDLDMVVFNNNTISTIIEIKRSKKEKVGKWQPYVNPTKSNDIPNYLMTMSLCNQLGCILYVVHHEILGSGILKGTDLIDIFTYYPNNFLPTQTTLNQFSANKNRQVSTVQNFIKLL